MRRRDPAERAADLRDEADEYDAIAEALVDLRAEIEAVQGEEADASIAETRLAGLFDEATTSDPSIWNTVTAFIDLEDGEAVVTEESKLAAGKWAPEVVEGCDAMVTVDVQPGYTPSAFASIASSKLEARVEEFREEAQQARAEAAELEAASDEA